MKKKISWEEFKKSKYIKNLEKMYKKSIDEGESINWKNKTDAQNALGKDKVSKAFIDFLYG